MIKLIMINITVGISALLIVVNLFALIIGVGQGANLYSTKERCEYNSVITRITAYRLGCKLFEYNKK